MFGQQIHQLRMHEWFTAKDPKKGGPMFLGVVDGPVKCVEINGVLFRDIHPTALTSEIARIKN